MNRFLFLVITVLFFLSEANAAGPFRVYGSSFTGEDKGTVFYEKTLEAIRKAVYPREVVVYSADWKGLDRAIAHKDADLIIAGAAAYRRNVHSGLRDLVTAVTPFSPDPDHVMGSVIYVLNQDDRILSLKDLKGKILGTNKPGAYRGELTVLKELHDNGYDPKNFFKKTLYLGDDVNARLKALEDGRADAIVLDTCFAENKRARGEEDPTVNLRVINEKKNLFGPCVTSTDLYPGYSILIPPHLDVSTVNKISKEIEAANGNMPKGYEWKIASDFTLIDDLYRELKIGPFEHLSSQTIQDFFEQYKTYFLLVSLFVVLYIYHSIRITFLVRKRTLQLQNFFDRERQLKDKIQKINDKYQTIRSRQEVSQLCSAVAHDMSQPLSSILLFSDTLKSLLARKENELKVDFKKEQEAVGKIQLRAEKLNNIVQLVRDFARGKTVLENRELNQVVETAIQDFLALNSLNPSCITCDSLDEKLEIYCSSDQLKLALINLLNNSLQASMTGVTTHIFLRLQREGNRGVLKIWDTGPKISEHTLEAIRERTRVKTQIHKDGLGLGLSIVKSIVSLHSGTMLFGISQQGGLAVSVELPLSKVNYGSKEQR